MCAFIVNPPIQDDADYYRHDDHIVSQILAGESKLVIGLRRSGKTSFLYRVRRAAQARKISCVYLALADVGDPELEALSTPPDVVLLDEAEVWRTWAPAQTEKLLRAIRRAKVVVITCAPEFILELEQELDVVQRFIDGVGRHLIGPLSDDEARDLLTHGKRQGPPLLSEAQVGELLASTDRLAILLQALGAERAGTVDLAVSLSGFGKRILTGLTPAARGILVDAAHDLPVDDGAETELLIATGALRRTSRGAAIASGLLAELVSKASPRTIPPPRLGDSRPPVERERWDRHARILHLSDLHFGRQAIDPPPVQARRLIAALERFDRIPDFVAVTGDLSWSGHRSELRDAETFLEYLVQWLRDRRGWDDLEARRRVLIVPGNHEASWLLSRGVHGAGGAAASEEDLEHWVRYSLGPFANFVNRFYRRSAFWDLDDPALATTFTEPSISFLSLSTAHYITEAMRDAKFGVHALERATALLTREDVASARFRVGVWHHNLRPFQSQVGAIADVDVAISGFLRAKPSLDLALHGHVHQGEVETFRPRGSSGEMLTYSAVGSFGVAAHHRPGDDLRGRVYNEFAVVELHTSGAAGRRMQTEFYALRLDANASWIWEPAAMSKPRPL